MKEETRNKTPLTDAQKKANNMEAHKRYMDKHQYVDLKIQLTRDNREVIQRYAKEHGYPSTNKFVKHAINVAMDNNLQYDESFKSQGED